MLFACWLHRNGVPFFVFFFFSFLGGWVILLLSSFLSLLQFNIVPELLIYSIGLMSKVRKVIAFVNLIDKFCKLH